MSDQCTDMDRRLRDLTEPWQQKSIVETNLHMLGNEILCDVTFLTGENKEPVRAHKFMLASRSPVFYAMFCGPFTESKDDAITVPDIGSNILRYAIEFMYTDECICSDENVMSLLYVAQKYDVEGLIKKCSQFLKDHMEPGNVCTILQQALVYNKQDLVDDCLAFIEDNGKIVLQTETFKHLDKQEILKIIQLDNLYVEEENVYKACIEWAKHKILTNEQDVSDKNIRECLGEVLYLIRFPIMPIETFTTVVAKDNVLISDEKVDVFKSYGGVVESSTKFCTHQRNYQGNMFRVKLFETIGLSMMRRNLTDAMSFSCSSDAKLLGVSLFTPGRICYTEGPFEIFEGNQTIYKQHVTIAYDASKKTRSVFFKRTIQINAGKTYTIKQTLGAPSRYCGVGLRERPELGGNQFTVRVFKSDFGRNIANSSDRFYRLIFRSK